MLFTQTSCSSACLESFLMTSPSRVVWFIWKWCCCSFQELCLTFYFRKLLTIIYYLNSSFQSSFLFSQVWRNTKRKQKYQVKGIFPWICFFLGFFSSFFNSSCWSEVTLLAFWCCSYPNEYRAVNIPLVSASLLVVSAEFWLALVVSTSWSH